MARPRGETPLRDQTAIEDVPSLVNDTMPEDTGNTLKIADAEAGTSILVLVADSVGVPSVIARAAERVSVSGSSMVFRIGIDTVVATVSIDRGFAMNTVSPCLHRQKHDLPLLYCPLYPRRHGTFQF